MARVMTQKRVEKRGESGATTLEFTFIAVTFFMMLLAITSGASLYFAHNVLVESTRRGARFAAMQAANTPAGTLRTTNGCDTTGPSLTSIQNFVMYGNAAGTGTELLPGLQPANICVEYAGFGVGTGSVSVSIIDYNYSVVIPFISRQITMPANRTTVRGESAGAFPGACP